MNGVSWLVSMSIVVAQVDMEERFCQRVKQLGCTCVTISHRPALMAFHDVVLALDGEGAWSLHRGARAAAHAPSAPPLPGAPLFYLSSALAEHPSHHHADSHSPLLV